MLLQKFIFQPNLLSILIFVGLLLFTAINHVYSVDQQAFECVDISKDQIIEYLFKNCYLYRKDFELRGIQPSNNVLQYVIRVLQNIHKLRQTGSLNNETCHVIHETSIDPVPLIQMKNRYRRYAFNNHHFNKTNINYWFKLELPPGDPRNQAVHEIIKKSFSMWSEVSPIVFRRNPYFWATDIKIKFARRNHDDRYPFDGRGGVVAHSFPPVKHFSNIHIDLDENWCYYGERGNKTHLSLLNVITHEIGHVLGLDHATGPGAIMFRNCYNVEKLCEDDINAIKRLYESSD